MEELTETQRRVVESIADHQQRTGSSPTLRELAKAMNWSSTNAVRLHLAVMEQKGVLIRPAGTSRSIRLLKPFAANRNAIPLLGRIRAGVPSEAIEESGEALTVSPGMFPGNKLFALRVKGDSMRDAGILDGDLAILDQQPTVENGEIAAVRIDSETTLKHFLRVRDAIVLRAANPDYADIVIKSAQGSDLAIAGRLVGVIRRGVRAA